MKARITRDATDMFSGNSVHKNTVVEIIEDNPKYDFVTVEVVKVGSRYTMKVWRCDVVKINLLAEKDLISKSK